MLFNPILLANNIAFFSFGYLIFFAITWLPGYLEQTYGLALKSVGWFLVLPWLTATVFVLFGGLLSDYIWKKTASIRYARSYVICISQLLSACAFLPILFEPTLPVAILSISLGLGFGMLPNAAFYALNADLAHDKAATSLGIMDSAFALAGILAPLLTGLLASMTGNFSTAFGLLTALTLLAVIVVFFFQHPEK